MKTKVYCYFLATLFSAIASCSLTQLDRQKYTRARTQKERVAKLTRTHTHIEPHTRAQRKRKIGPTKNKQKQLKNGVVGSTNLHEGA